MSPLKLNLGAGDQNIEGFTRVDLSEGAEIRMDLRTLPWPWALDSVDEILMSHVLEHFHRTTGFGLLLEARRVLRPGGRINIAVPDMDKFIDARLSGDWSGLNGYFWTDLNHFMGGDEREPLMEWRHRYMYCRASLLHTLMEAGFREVHSRGMRPGLDNPGYEAISVYAEGIK